MTGRGNVARFSAGMASGITELAVLSVVVSSATTRNGNTADERVVVSSDSKRLGPG